ncbi:toll/interleukin-1 receptor domain-containing protein [Azoarcus sp. L1K30]|uniref:toll/interleukin-1 receptor domain-containing protein n=1 Tax=Azoarcus sp. L1K30 TaxID=2820277 RepID=UPI001B83BA63|nr:toll/interleukin-1 receptor domain-containing protein [Azoarcus sp. L1K30]MBR0567177.1 toll/interleukin-1 receptor domain-containing protein [Azoarcus sp. L1K30]
MDGIFISYRREDSSGYAGRLYDRLAARFGRERVFMDVEGIDPGTDFVDAIDAAVASCTVLIVLIGPKWLGDDTGGARRIDDTHDFVRLETAAALRRKIRVLPVLVNDAEMPPEDALPPDLKALARRQAIEINHKQWEASTGEVLKALERIFGGGRPAWRLPAIVAAACCVLAVGAWLLWPGQHTTAPVSPSSTSAPESTAPTESEAKRGSRTEPTQLASAEAPASPASAGSTPAATPATPPSAAQAPAEPPAALSYTHLTCSGRSTPQARDASR